MISLQQIESDLITALKAKDSVAANTLRGLKVRIQNEQTAKGRPEQGEGSLSEEQIVSLVKSEIKRRKEAAESFSTGDRAEAAEKELQEAKILEKYLPEQMSEQELTLIIEQTIAEAGATAADFGKLMGQLKAKVGQTADGAMLAKILKEKLK